MIKAYLDTNVFITALQFGKTNSAKLINMSGKFMSLYTGVICEYLLEEIKDYYEKQNSRDHANKVVFFIKNLNLKTLSNLTVDMEKESYSSLITDADDLPHITAAIIEDCDYFVHLTQNTENSFSIFFTVFCFLFCFLWHSRLLPE
jgi:hypothetical protein